MVWLGNRILPEGWGAASRVPFSCGRIAGRSRLCAIAGAPRRDRLGQLRTSSESGRNCGGGVWVWLGSRGLPEGWGAASRVPFCCSRSVGRPRHCAIAGAPRRRVWQGVRSPSRRRRPGAAGGRVGLRAVSTALLWQPERIVVGGTRVQFAARRREGPLAVATYPGVPVDGRRGEGRNRGVTRARSDVSRRRALARELLGPKDPRIGWGRGQGVAVDGIPSRERVEDSYAL